MRRFFILLLTIGLIAGCKNYRAETKLAVKEPATSTAAPQPSVAQVKDPHTFSHPEEAAVNHLDLDLTVDFPSKRLTGVANLDITTAPDAANLVLDSRDLEISEVQVDGVKKEYKLGAPEKFVGSSLTIPILPSSKRVTIRYRTSPEAAALQWLDPSQTAGKKLPFLFTQSQAILARTWVPIQDTPSVRMTYDATVHAPANMLAIMSADENPREKNATGVYKFHMPQPIPSYLLALGVGDLAFRPFDKRTGVYAEPSVVEKAAWEFADTPKMVDAAEKMYGPYRWGRYDILVLPPSFPFGGMENPRLTFATPTVLAGDRSLVSLVAHELAHSWSGNLVTNATWNDFWLNEGFTNYFERRILEALYGRDYEEMQASLAFDDLRDTVAEMKDAMPDTRLKLELTGRDPDEGVGSIAYEKGYFLLRHIEESVGRDAFDKFLRGYFDRHAFTSITTEQFLADLDANLLQGKPGLQADVREWIYKEGIPANISKVQSAAFERVDAELASFLKGTPASQLPAAKWSTSEWTRFLNGLPKDLPAARMKELDDAFHLTQSGNSQILQAWLLESIRTSYHATDAALENFLLTVGRRLYIKPLYTELMKTPEGTKKAKAIYAKARSGYHAVSRETLDKIVMNAKR